MRQVRSHALSFPCCLQKMCVLIRMANTRRASRKDRKNRKSSRKAERKNNLAGGAKIKAVGSKAEVFHGTAKHTSGGLTRKDLLKNKHGRIVSRRKQAAGRKALANLRKAGYVAKKGTFKLFRKHSKRGGSDSGLMMGGSDSGLKQGFAGL